MKIGKHKKATKKQKEKEMAIHFGDILLPELFNMEPEDFTLDYFIDLAGTEAWNLDEFNETGYMMLKHMLFRMVMPKELWDNSGKPASTQCDVFCGILKKKYLAALKN